jgi:glycerol-3-phosphate acyltransferase PlsY
MKPALVLLQAYLLGSIPFGYLLVRLLSGSDIRESGSGGTGATNVSRKAGKGAGVATLLLDALKGFAAVLIAQRILDGSSDSFCFVGGAAIAALLGHIFPVWLRFRGGKGVATAIGAFLVLDAMALAIAGLIFLLVVALTRYVSLGSILAAVSLPILILVQQVIGPVPNFESLIFTATVAAGLIILAHRTNIGRLVTGSENKFG